MDEMRIQLLGDIGFVAASWSSSVMATVSMIWQPLVLTTLIFSAICGLIAVASPACFKALAEQGGRWIDTSRIVACLDWRFDVDHYALRHPRAFGLAVSISAIFLAVCCFWR
jgi:hypothetical protein